MRKLVCDKCGKELSDKDDIDLVLEGQEAWAAAARERGTEPRGVLPCENYVRCSGEMILTKDGKIFKQRQ